MLFRPSETSASSSLAILPAKTTLQEACVVVMDNEWLVAMFLVAELVKSLPVRCPFRFSLARSRLAPPRHFSHI